MSIAEAARPESASPEVAATESARSEARRRAIIEVAREVFLAHGYAAASMSEIAVRMGGSKGTLYNYFRSKEELFEAFMVDTCGKSANALLDHLPRVALIEIGAGFLSFVLDAPIMSVHRLVVAEAGRFPELGRVFYETGPRNSELKLGEYLGHAMDAGRLRRGDPIEAARRLRDLVMSDVYNRRLWGVIDEPTPEQIRAHVTRSVEIFLAAFGVDG
jgi:AcrR family transcriptional regulator